LKDVINSRVKLIYTKHTYSYITVFVRNNNMHGMAIVRLGWVY